MTQMVRRISSDRNLPLGFDGGRGSKFDTCHWIFREEEVALAGPTLAIGFRWLGPFSLNIRNFQDQIKCHGQPGLSDAWNSREHPDVWKLSAARVRKDPHR